jgi:hypothetical protein
VHVRRPGILFLTREKWRWLNVPQYGTYEANNKIYQQNREFC